MNKFWECRDKMNETYLKYSDIYIDKNISWYLWVSSSIYDRNEFYYSGS